MTPRGKLRSLRQPKTIANVIIKSAVILALVLNAEAIQARSGYFMGLAIIGVGILSGAFLVDLLLGPTFPNESEDS